MIIQKQSPVGQAVGQGLGAIGSLIGSIGQKRRDKLNQIRQHRYNLELADHNFAQNLEMWNRQNEYNLPINQMQRLKDAGINPHLAYAKGGVQNQAGTQPQYIQEGQDMSLPMAINPQSVLQQYQTFRQGEVQRNLTQASADLTSEKADTENLVQSLQALNIVGKGIDNAMQGVNLKYQNQAKRAEVANLQVDVAKKLAETANQKAGLAKIKAETQNIKATTGLTMQKVLTEAVNRKLTTEQTKSELVKRGLISSQTTTEAVKRMLIHQQALKSAQDRNIDSFTEQYQSRFGVQPSAGPAQYLHQGFNTGIWNFGKMLGRAGQALKDGYGRGR